MPTARWPTAACFTPPALRGAARARQPAPRGRRRSRHLVTDILADNNARAGTFGLDSALRTRGFAAVKTGTSKDLRDNWCVGFTDRYTVGVWVGNASGAPMHDVSGISGAAPVWQALVQHLHRGQPSHGPGGAGRRGAQARTVTPMPGSQRRDELFITGTEPSARLARAQRGLRQGIASPADGSIFALDPDMPPAVQRITFEGERGTLGARRQGAGHGRALVLGTLAGPARAAVLQAADGRALQRVKFEVRGAGVKVAGALGGRPPAFQSTSPDPTSRRVP
jgi:penicillin-binding protein 1C